VVFIRTIEGRNVLKFTHSLLRCTIRHNYICPKRREENNSGMHIGLALLAAAVATIANAEVHVVDVGADGLKFEPQTINPKKGDTVVFHLYSPHNVVSSTFDKPCESNDNSWFSGPFDQTDNGKKKFVVNVTSEDPVCAHSDFDIPKIPKLTDQTLGVVLLRRSTTLPVWHGGSLECAIQRKYHQSVH
jgi:plastocyanin